MEITAIVLAAGKGTRMKSEMPKVMHKITNMPLVEHVLRTTKDLGIADVRVVSSEELKELTEFKALNEEYKFSTNIQKERLGTGHAVKCASDNLKGAVLILYGDVPLIKPQTITKMQEKFTDAKIVCLGFEAENPHGYGRLITYQDDVIDIVEEKDATTEQRSISLCNSGIYLIDGEILSELLDKLKNNNATGEYYLTDIVKLANTCGHRCVLHVTNESEVMGVNDKKQLALVEHLKQEELRDFHLRNGVTMIDPKSVFFSSDTEIAADVIIHPNVIIGEGVKIASGAEIMPFSHLVGCSVGHDSRIGPYARLREKTIVGNKCKIGNFVEVKAAHLADSVKSSHLSYIGDAEIGESTNIGAGTIFCNYDGYMKHKSKIGQNVFIGSNSALVSPVNLGDDSIVAAGSVITEDVDDNTLAIARARQSNYKNKAELIRKKKRS